MLCLFLFAEGKEALTEIVAAYECAGTEYHGAVLDQPIRLSFQNSYCKRANKIIGDHITYNDIQSETEGHHTILSLIPEGEIFVQKIAHNTG